MRPSPLALVVLAGCVTTQTFPAPRSDEVPLTTGHATARSVADPRWREAREDLERLSERCEARREHLQHEADEARVDYGVASAIAVALTIAGELAGVRGSGRGVAMGEARCPAPAGPTTTLAPEQQQTAIPCGGMAAAGGGGPIAQRAIDTQVRQAEEAERMREAIDLAAAFLDERRDLAEWGDEDVRAWDEHYATLRTLCVE